MDFHQFGTSEEFPKAGLLAVWLIHTCTFGVGEEVGWRGFALPRLQSHRSAFVATLIMSGFWALWHLPAFFYRPHYSSMDLPAVAGWFCSIVAGAVLLTWLYNSSKGSIFIVALFHGSIDIAFTSKGVGPATMTIMGALFIIWAMAVLIITRPANLSLSGKQVYKD